jgi:hypothetical protein
VTPARAIHGAPLGCGALGTAAAMMARCADFHVPGHTDLGRSLMLHDPAAVSLLEGSFRRLLS